MSKSYIYYFDADGQSCEKQHAMRAIVRELDGNGNVVNETFAFVTHDITTSLATPSARMAKGRDIYENVVKNGHPKSLTDEEIAKSEE